MTYIFRGFFTNDNIKEEKLDSAEFIYRRISDQHNVRAGLLATSLLSDDYDDLESENSRECLVCKLAEKLLLVGINHSLFLDYFCWGGALEVVMGYEIRNGKIVPNSLISGNENNGESAGDAFSLLAKNFGVVLGTGDYFEAFERDFWGDDGC